MHVIRTTRADVLEAFDGPTEHLTPALVDSILKPVYENKLRIFDTTFAIENTIQRIIEHYFFGDDPSNKERATRFSRLVLASDWCTFSAKRRLVTHIVNETEALSGATKAEYDKLLGDVMAARNAFAHGIISTDGRRVKLSYFQGAPRTQFLNDDYLKQIEAVLNRCFELTQQVAASTGAIRVKDLPAAADPLR